MNEFENELIINEEVYQNGFFPKVPTIGKRGSAFMLTGGCHNDILVSERTTVKEIRKGKYNKLVEISTLPYLKEIRFNSPSKETYYSFDVYVKAVIQVSDPIAFYENRNVDVHAYFKNLFSLDVKKITGRYSILNYIGMDDELTEKLSSYNTFDKSTGFSYQISVVDATPGERAQEYVQKYGKQQLDTELRKKAIDLSHELSKTYEDAIMTEVVEGHLTMSEAIVKIDEYNNSNFDSQIDKINTLRKDDLITDSQARDYVIPVIKRLSEEKQIQQLDKNLTQNHISDFDLNEFYTEDE